MSSAGPTGHGAVRRNILHELIRRRPDASGASTRSGITAGAGMIRRSEALVWSSAFTRRDGGGTFQSNRLKAELRTDRRAQKFGVPRLRGGMAAALPDNR